MVSIDPAYPATIGEVALWVTTPLGTRAFALGAGFTPGSVRTFLLSGVTYARTATLSFQITSDTRGDASVSEQIAIH